MPEHRACLSCRAPGVRPLLDFGSVPLADELVVPGEEHRESRYPLAVGYCPSCMLVQLTTILPPRMLYGPRYLYFSGYSDAFRAHAREMARQQAARFALGPDDLVVEIGSNDGTLLAHLRDTGARVLGIDPAPAQASVAQGLGVPVVRAFFGREVAEDVRARHGPARLVVATNVLAHAPDLDDMFSAIASLLDPAGHLVFENPYLRDLVDHGEYDTIFHEHVFYYSCTAVADVLRRRGLHVHDVEYFPGLHGGTLRWFASRADIPRSPALRALVEAERTGVANPAVLERFAGSVTTARGDLRRFLTGLRAEGARIAAYGAAAKGASLLNYAGIGKDLVEFVVDRNPHKHGFLLPGSHVPVRPVETLLDDRPDYTLLLAWNFADEILAQQAAYLASGGRFIIPIPAPQVVTGGRT